jgi:hypothetical protein
MRVIVEIVAGPSAGRKLELRTGQAGVVGRASGAELSLRGDESMAGEHFVVECDRAGGCLLRALTRGRPVYLNGVKVTKEPLKDGDEITAGDNTFKVTIELEPSDAAKRAPAPTPVVVAPAPKAGPSGKESAERAVDLLKYLRNSQPLYALLDAARDEQILELLQSAKVEYQSLYEGSAAEELAAAAPYLVRLPAESKLLETLARDGWGKSWGVYLTCQQPFKEVRKHLRRFLKVESEREEYLFRFYDPRVLRVFLPVCTAEETGEFFGPVDRFLMEAKDSALLLKYQAVREGVREEPVALFAV